MMNNQESYRLTSTELSITLIGMIIGVSVLTIPRSLSREIGTPDGWLSICLSGLFVMLLIYLYTKLQRQFPGQTLLQYLSKGTYGKWLARLFSILFIIYFTLLVSFEVRIVAIITQLYLLFQTPSEFIVAVFLLTSTYATSKGLQGIIHLNLLFVPFTLITMFLLSFLNVDKTNFDSLLPILSEGVMPVITGMKVTLTSFLGIEILFFLMAYMKPKDIRSLPLNLSITVISFIYISITVIVYSVFSFEPTQFITFPTIELAKEIELPGGFIERLESLFIVIWMMTIINTTSISHFLAVQTLKKQFFKHKQASFLPSVIAFFAFILAFFPNNIAETMTFAEKLGWFGAALFLSGLCLGSLTYWIRQRQQKKKPSREK